jgi:rRNA maturation endonuclease Nob1
MTEIAKIVLCKECGKEIRSDWKFCPHCGSTIVCKIQEAKAKKLKQSG